MQQKIISPCVDVCKIDKQTGFCKGCYRTIREITNWSKLNYDAQKDLLKTLKVRKSSI
jgi:hypothetical protein